MPGMLTRLPESPPQVETGQGVNVHRGTIAIALLVGRAPAVRRAVATFRPPVEDRTSNLSAESRRLLEDSPDVDDALAMPLQDAIARGQRMLAALPANLIDIDLGPAL